jgi:hypothetical protein
MDAMSVATEFSRAVEAGNWNEARRLQLVVVSMADTEGEAESNAPQSWSSLSRFMTNTLAHFGQLEGQSYGVGGPTGMTPAWLMQYIRKSMQDSETGIPTERAGAIYSYLLVINGGLGGLAALGQSEIIDRINKAVRPAIIAWGKEQGLGPGMSPNSPWYEDFVSGGGGGQRNGQLRLAMSAPLADRVRSAVGMRTTLDELIGHLEAGQRLQAGCGCGCKRIQAQVAPAIGAGAAAAATVFGLPAVILAAMAILGAKYGPEIAQKLQQFFQGQPTTFAPDENAKISEAIAQANAQTVADFRAGTQSDYGLSFNPARAWEPDVQGVGDELPLETFGLGTWEATADGVWAQAITELPSDPCGWLKGRRAEHGIAPEAPPEGTDVDADWWTTQTQAIDGALKKYCVSGSFDPFRSWKESTSERAWWLSPT